MSGLKNNTGCPKLSVLLCLCGDEPYEAAERTVLSVCEQVYSNWELVIACADNYAVYQALKDGAFAEKMILVDLCSRPFAGVAQFYNAAAAYASGDVLLFAECGDVWCPDVFGKLLHSRVVPDFLTAVADGYCSRYIVAVDRTLLEKAGGWNGKLLCGAQYEWLVRVAAQKSPDGLYMLPLEEAKGSILPGSKEEQGASGQEVKEQGTGEPVARQDKAEAQKVYPMPQYAEMYETYAFVLANYFEELKACGQFDGLVLSLLTLSQNQGVNDYCVSVLESMLGHSDRYYDLLEAGSPVLVLMGDPICGDVLTNFAYEFMKCLRRAFVPVEVFDMSKEPVADMRRFPDRTYRALVGFQTALITVRSGEMLINNFVHGPKINFLYDHPLRLYDFFTLPLERHFLLTQDEDYAAYINRYYPCIKQSLHLPPAGIELCAEERVAWEDKKTEPVFVANYYNYRLRLKEMDKLEEPLKTLSYALFAYAKENPNLPIEQAFERVLDAQGMAVEDAQFAKLLFSCADATKAVIDYYRELTVKTILDAGITLHVYGETWLESPFVRHPHMKIYRDVSCMDGIRAIANAKISLNIMSWHKAGMTERIANTMLNRSVCVTDRTRYLEEHFAEGEEYVSFDLEHLEELPKKLAALQCDDARAKRIAMAGYRKAGKEHRWQNRVDKFLEMLDNDIFA